MSQSLRLAVTGGHPMICDDIPALLLAKQCRKCASARNRAQSMQPEYFCPASVYCVPCPVDALLTIDEENRTRCGSVRAEHWKPLLDEEVH